MARHTPLAILFAAVLALAAAAPVPVRAAGGWTLTPLTTPNSGTQGPKMPTMNWGGDELAFTSDGNLVAVPGNADGNVEVYGWDATVGLSQVTDTSHAMGGFPSQSRAYAQRAGHGIAFLSNADLAGSNADHSVEVFLAQPGSTLPFVQVTNAPAGTAAEGPSIDGGNDDRMVFWHTGNLTGDNPDGSSELYLADLSGGNAQLFQLTNLTGHPYHSLPAIADLGQAAAFVVSADVTGGNADGGMELFLWRGPYTHPGDPASFRQLTDNHAPMVGHELYDPTLNQDGSRVAFAARGAVDASMPVPLINAEVIVWDALTGLTRLTTATGGGTDSAAPRLSADGTHLAFVSQSDLAPGQPGNTDETAELFVWSKCGGMAQVTHSANRPGVFSLTSDLVPAFDQYGAHAAFIAEKVDDPNPMVLTRSGVLFRAVEDNPTPCGVPTATPVPTRAPTPTALPAGPVCPQLANRVPPAVLADAIANPATVGGWGQRANPGLPPGPNNPLRTWLSLLDIGKPFGPANGVVWKAGCP